jgi:hypothetical protein
VKEILALQEVGSLLKENFHYISSLPLWWCLFFERVLFFVTLKLKLDKESASIYILVRGHVEKFTLVVAQVMKFIFSLFNSKDNCRGHRT